jgi:hypothetical protein
MFETPVLFLTFNRLDTTKQVFSVIRQIKPKYFYIASDGPRADHEGEKAKVEAVRRYMLDNIDWDCEIKTLFRDKNLGCGKGPASAITWFFEQVEQGIILEDDCIPSIGFFSYCAALLERYKDNEKIYHVAGDNPLGLVDIPDSYYFARIQHCWGWATWRRAWNKYDYDMPGLMDFVTQKKINKIFRRKCDREYWLNIFKKMEKHQTDVWDYQWTYTIFRNEGLCINPAKNLVSNIGFGGDGTHTFGNSFRNNQKRYELVDIKYPEKIEIKHHLVDKINKIVFGIDDFWLASFKKNYQRCLALLRKCKRFVNNIRLG